MKIRKKITEKSLKKNYEKCKPAMKSRFGRILSYAEFCQTLSYAHERGLDK